MAPWREWRQSLSGVQAIPNLTSIFEVARLGPGAASCYIRRSMGSRSDSLFGLALDHPDIISSGASSPRTAGQDGMWSFLFTHYHTSDGVDGASILDKRCVSAIPIELDYKTD